MVIVMENKKRTFILCSVLIIMLGVGIIFICRSTFNNNNNNNKESKLVSISVTELEAKMNKKENFVLVLSQTGCSHCEQYLPELDRTLKEVKFNAFVINVTDLSSEEMAVLNRHVNFSGTPTTIFFHEGNESTTLNRIVGYAGKAKIIERLKSLGYID